MLILLSFSFIHGDRYMSGFNW